MKIAMLGQKGIPAMYGGVERHVHDLSLHLAEMGHAVTVYSRRWYAKQANTNISGVRVQFVPSIHTKHLDTITHVLLGTVHALFQEYDVLHYHGVGPALLSWIPKIFAPKTKVVTTFHSIDRYHQKWGTIARWFLRMGEWCACAFADETITVSKSLEQYCLNEFYKETTYIPNGTDNVPKAEGKQTIAKFGLEKNKYLVMVSRLIPHKGAHILIEAFKRLKMEHPDNARVRELKLAIVGDSVHTDTYVALLKKQSERCADIVFTGFQSDEALTELYQHALSLIHPSFNEGLPLTVLQAMSLGKPALLSAIPEHLELVRDARVLFKENNVKSLTDTLESFLNMDVETHETIGTHNKQVIEKNYRWDVIVPQIVTVYQKEKIKEKVRLRHKLA